MYMKHTTQSIFKIHFPAFLNTLNTTYTYFHEYETQHDVHFQNSSYIKIILYTKHKTLSILQKPLSGFLKQYLYTQLIMYMKHWALPVF